MNKELKERTIFYLNQLKAEKELAADSVKAMTGYANYKKDYMLLEIQKEVNELERIILELQEDDL